MNADRFKGPAGSVCDEAGAQLSLQALGVFSGQEQGTGGGVPELIAVS